MTLLFVFLIAVPVCAECAGWAVDTHSALIDRFLTRK
jgi:hypothetical protein